MGKVTTKKSEPKTPQVRETRNPPGFEHFLDWQADICDPQYPFPISSIKPEIFRRHIENRDRYRVVLSGLYYQITPPVYPVVEFICWLRDSYNKHQGMFLSAQGNRIFTLSPDIIRKSLRFPTSSNYVSFNEVTLTPQFAKFPWKQQGDFNASITNDQTTTLPSVESFPLSLFKEEVHPILALIAGLLSVDGFGKTSRGCVALLWLMSQTGVVLDIPGFLASTIQT